MSYLLNGKVAIVTGSSGGIGREIAKLLAGEKAIVVLSARSKDKIEALSKELPGSIAITTDLRNGKDRQNLIEKTVKEFKRIDILVNNAGQGMYSRFEDTNIEEYRKIMELNVFAVMDLMQKVIPIMRANGGGRILNISSLLAKIYMPNFSAYASTKSALNTISLTAREELKADNIVVSVMHPKLTSTNFGANSVGGDRLNIESLSQDNNLLSDTPQQVAIKTIELIKSGEAEYSM
ncbi:MAG TPA: SDR family NAD(P)-dependent oxidoreductase [Candidatus Hydrogenedens sp.]|nr:SDR family NAD(P)-dependent oxidoreductase [Candidatus Hydrogenedens sp.]